MISTSITVSQRDMRRLSTLLDTSLTYRYPRESALLGEVLSHAAVAADGQISERVVTMGSTVFCDDAEGAAREICLVYPWDADPFAGFVSVLSPLGVALLGLRAGDIAEWTDDDGDAHWTHVVDVVPGSGK